jgi:hypothetical protein
VFAGATEDMLLLDELPAMQNKQVLVSEAADDFHMMPSAKGGVIQSVPPTHTHKTPPTTTTSTSARKTSQALNFYLDPIQL